MNKEELKKSWPLICVHKKDSFTEGSAKKILQSNIGREEWVGKEECPKKTTPEKPTSNFKGVSGASKAKSTP